MGVFFILFWIGLVVGFTFYVEEERSILLYGKTIRNGGGDDGDGGLR